jgi:hypothetical protein
MAEARWRGEESRIPVSDGCEGQGVAAPVSQVSRATQQSTDEAVAGLFETHVIVPVQFFVQSATVRTGEQRLMAAVLEDAIRLYLKPIPPSPGKLRQKLQDVLQQTEYWLRSNDRAWAFSFLRICDALNLDPQYLRRGLRQLHRHAGVIDAPHSPTWTDIGAGMRSASGAPAS